MALQKISSPIDLLLAINADDAPKEVRGYIQSIINALQQLQLAFNTFAGASMQPLEDWGTVTPNTTLISGNANRLYARASENLAFGQTVNYFDDAGTRGIRKANATNNTKPCHGWCSTAGGILAGSFGEVQVGITLNTGVAGLVRGSRYAQDIGGGGVVAVAPVAAGNIEQWIGLAIDADKLLMFPNVWWIQH